MNRTLQDILNLLHEYNHDNKWNYYLVITDWGCVTIEDDEFNCKPLGTSGNLTICYDMMAWYISEMKK